MFSEPPAELKHTWIFIENLKISVESKLWEIFLSQHHRIYVCDFYHHLKDRVENREINGVLAKLSFCGSASRCLLDEVLLYLTLVHQWHQAAAGLVVAGNLLTISLVSFAAEYPSVGSCFISWFCASVLSYFGTMLCFSCSNSLTTTITTIITTTTFLTTTATSTSFVACTLPSLYRFCFLLLPTFPSTQQPGVLTNHTSQLAAFHPLLNFVHGCNYFTCCVGSWP